MIRPNEKPQYSRINYTLSIHKSNISSSQTTYTAGLYVLGVSITTQAIGNTNIKKFVKIPPPNYTFKPLVSIALLITMFQDII